MEKYCCKTILQQSHMSLYLYNGVHSEWLNIQNSWTWCKGYKAKESRKERRNQCRIKRNNFIKNGYIKSHIWIGYRFKTILIICCLCAILRLICNSNTVCTIGLILLKFFLYCKGTYKHGEYSFHWGSVLFHK